MPPRLDTVQVKELRAVLRERGGQRHVDMASTRDAALEALGARDARIHELQTTVHEMTEQLQRQAKALALGVLHRPQCP